MTENNGSNQKQNETRQDGDRSSFLISLFPEAKSILPKEIEKQSKS
jgi:hypothetical protein